uniref:Uncharacterized protein n=1 Tax=Sphaerodactylus townsendi TaxID=933632 RepID=A0ACB8FHQ3_9SAUR
MKEGGASFSRSFSGQRRQLRSVTEDESPRILSEEEMNRLGAKIVKAELIGNTGLAAQLQAQLDNARKLKESKAQISARKPEEEVRKRQLP